MGCGASSGNGALDPDGAPVTMPAAIIALETSLGPRHPDVLAAMTTQAGSYCAEGKAELALPLYRKVVKVMRERPGGIANTGALAAIRALSACLGRDEDAARGPLSSEVEAELQPLYAEFDTKIRSCPRDDPTLALHISGCKACAQSLGECHATTLMLLNTLATRQDNMGHKTDALATYRRVLKGRQAELGASHLSTLMTAMNLGALVLATEEDKLEATALLQQAHDGLLQQLGEDDKRTKAAAIWLRKCAAVPDCASEADVTLTGVTKSSYAAGETIELSWRNTRRTVGECDWIGLCNVATCGAPGGGSIPLEPACPAWWYLDGGNDKPSQAASSPGVVSLTIPSDIAQDVQYALYYCKDDGYAIEAMSTPFNVTAR